MNLAEQLKLGNKKLIPLKSRVMVRNARPMYIATYMGVNEEGMHVFENSNKTKKKCKLTVASANLDLDLLYLGEVENVEIVDNLPQYKIF
jgi:hypothetical protein